jgi:glycine hydroxymethyltransferase
VIAGKAVAFFEALQPSFRAYAQAVIDNARALARRWKSAATASCRAAPTTIWCSSTCGRDHDRQEGGRAARSGRITVSKSMVPFDETKPWITSGIRLGTPA